MAIGANDDVIMHRNAQYAPGIYDLLGQLNIGATVGCETLKIRVTPGRSYLLPDGIWREKGDAPISLPAYCGN